MFQQLDLKYFRQHEDLSITFENGVVALRGRNEAGKTTILEGIAYAMFGASALREALEDVVTWGRKPGDLKVALEFHLNGVDYRTTRSKSGAEIKVGEKVLATGQKEVTKYVETLLGASADVCTKLMLANQDDIKGALSKGPSAAIELIEALSNLGVIDTIIGLAQAQLPCGATTAVLARVQTLEAQVADPVLDETGPLVQALDEAEGKKLAAQELHDEAKVSYDAIQPAAVEAQTALDRYDRLQDDEGNACADYERAKVTLGSFVVPDAPDEARIEELRKLAVDSGYMQRAISAAGVLGGWEEAAEPFRGDVAACTAERDKHVQADKVHSRTISDCAVQIARLEAQKITQTACGLCGKDLSAVPEVVRKNSDLDTQIAALETQREHAQSAGLAERQLAKHYQDLLDTDTRNRRLHAKATEFGTLVETKVPCGIEWTGPAEFPDEVDETDYAAELRAAEAKVQARQRAEGQLAQLRQQANETKQRLVQAEKVRMHAEQGIQAHQDTLSEAAERLAVLSRAEATLLDAQEAVKSARQALDSAQAVLRERQKARAAMEAQLAAARKELSEMDDNNALIKFLREARPTITDQLWGLVTNTVSSYFSDIRGTQSVVTRSDNGFKVDGHNVAGLSGSTKDALGLAIRMALTRTFLPNASFLILDEAAAGCDDERESNMLGVVSAGGFEQVILISHSDLVDSFATQLVQV